MKVLMKILFAPVLFLLAVIVWVGALLVRVSSVVLGLVSILFAIIGIIYLAEGMTMNGIIGLVIAFLLCPYGLPMAAVMLLGGVQRLRLFIKEAVY